MNAESRLAIKWREKQSRKLDSLKFLHKSGITLRPGGTPEICRWWNHRDCDPILSSPGGATDRSRSVAPPGLGGSTGLVPVVPPPANLHRASGAKTCVETLAGPLCATFPTTPVSYGLFIQVENAVVSLVTHPKGGSLSATQQKHNIRLMFC